MNTIQLQFKDLDLEVDYTYFEGEPMVWTLPNGDPGHPGTGDTVDIDEARVMTVDGDYVNIGLLGHLYKTGLLEELKEAVIEAHND